MSTTQTLDRHLPVKRLQLSTTTGALVVVAKEEPYVRGPIPLWWLAKAAKLPGKALSLALALWWLHGMSKGKAFKVTRQALNALNVSRDAMNDGLNRLEQAGLISVVRRAGQRSTVKILNQNPDLLKAGRVG